MKKICKKGLTLALTAALAVTTFAGCGKQQNTADKNQDLSKYPVKTKDSLTYWVALNGNVTATAQTLNDTKFAKEMEKETGIKVKYIHPAIGNEDESFNILIASDSLPDIVEHNWYKYPGGYSMAFADDLVVDLTPYLDTYLSDYDKAMKKDIYSPMIRGAMITDDGKFFGVQPLTDKGDVNIKSVYGPMFRQDWLDELGLELPQTIDEWTEALRAFKEKKGAVKPLTFIYEYIGFYAILAGSFGVKQEFYPVDGRIVYGPMQKGYKDFVTKLHEWYEEGLLDNGFATVDEDARDSALMNGECGVTYGFLGSNLLNWENNMQATQPGAKLSPAQHPSLKKGKPCEIAPSGNIYGKSAVAAITTKCKNPDLAAKFLNFGYTEKGKLLYNFGIENESYVMEDGIPHYTDLIKNDPKLSMSQMLCAYTRVAYTGPLEISDRYIKEYYSNPKQIEAIKLWGFNNGEKYDMPYLNVSEEDAQQVASIEAKIKQYTDEMTMKFISGAEDIKNFDKYVKNLKQFGADDAAEIYQNAYEKAIKATK